MKRFDSKIVLLTGASSGIGRQAAKMFAFEGATVIGLARHTNLLEGLKQEVANEGGVFIPYTGDLTHKEDIYGVIKFTIDKFGRIDVLVNNAGAMDFGHYGVDLTDEMWDNCIAVNMTAPMILSRESLKYMRKQGGGAIVNVGSAASVRGTVSGTGYTASKHGLVGLTKNIAYRYASENIRCNIICPGGVDTFMCSAECGAMQDPDGYAFSNKTCSMMVRLSTVEEQANVILFLASDDASVLNGAIISTDSGFAAS